MKPLTPENPHVIVMVGIPGSGKSSFAHHFAQTFQAPIVSQSSLERVYDLDRTQAEKITAHFLDELLKTRRTLVIDGGTERIIQRMNLYKTVTKHGYQVLTVWVQTDTNESKRRSLRQQPRGGGVTSDQFDAQLQQFQAPTPQEKPVVISGKHTYATQLKVVLKQLAGTRALDEVSSKPTTRPHGRQISIR
jgi:predicted kinase